MKLILHIGTAKTGTSSIQGFLKKNIDQLKRNAIYVPKVPMTADGNHRWAPLFANYNKSDDFVRKLRFKSDKDKKRVIDEKSEFIAECQNAVSTCNTIILSSEHFQSRLIEVDALQEAARLTGKSCR